MSRTGLSSLLEIEHPIIQAPMVGVSTPELAAAVSNAGALGSIGLGASNPEQGRELIRRTRALTARPFNVNLFCHTPAAFDETRNQAWLTYMAETFAEFDANPPRALKEIYQSFVNDRAMLDMLLEERPPVVSFHFGVPPKEWIAELKMAGIFTLGCATTLLEARQLEQAGIQAIVAQGYEAGGHRGVFDDAPGQDDELGLFALLRIIRSSVDLPVIAAGGIMDGAVSTQPWRSGQAAANWAPRLSCARNHQQRRNIETYSKPPKPMRHALPAVFRDGPPAGSPTVSTWRRWMPTCPARRNTHSLTTSQRRCTRPLQPRAVMILLLNGQDKVHRWPESFPLQCLFRRLFRKCLNIKSHILFKR